MPPNGQKIGVWVNCPIDKENRESLSSFFDLHFAEEVPSRDNLLADIGDAVEVIISDGPRYVTSDLMNKMPNLKLICLQSVGIDYVDLDFVKTHGIQITNAAGTNAPSCADHAFALLLATSRYIIANDKAMRISGANEECEKVHSTTIYGKKIGILGLGAIGLEIAKRAIAFDMPVSYHNRQKRIDVPYDYFTSVTELARDVQILVVCCPGGDATHHLVNTEVLEALGPNGTLINIARGSVVDTPALVNALQKGVIKNAGLDVVGGTATERAPLCEMENVVMSPHLAGNTEEAWQNRCKLTKTVMMEFLNNEKLTNQVI